MAVAKNSEPTVTRCTAVHICLIVKCSHSSFQTNLLNDITDLGFFTRPSNLPSVNRTVSKVLALTNPRHTNGKVKVNVSISVKVMHKIRIRYNVKARKRLRHFQGQSHNQGQDQVQDRGQVQGQGQVQH